MKQIELDHFALLTSRTARRKAHRELRKVATHKLGAVVIIHVLHEHDDSCCKREPWLETAKRLWEAVGEKTLYCHTYGLEEIPPKGPHIQAGDPLWNALEKACESR
jgi:hypothetical protein